MINNKVLSIILGGGQGSRLYPLTEERSKPAVSIAGKYRLVDIPISNCINADIKRIFVLTQFNSAGLNKHIKNVIEVSKERKKLFIDQTKNSFKISNENSGLHIIGKLTNTDDDVLAYKTLLKKNVIAYPLSNYYINKEKVKGLVMGYSSVNNKVMKEKTAIL